MMMMMVVGIPRSTRYDAVFEDLVVKGWRLHMVSIFTT